MAVVRLVIVVLVVVVEHRVVVMVEQHSRHDDGRRDCPLLDRRRWDHPILPVLASVWAFPIDLSWWWLSSDGADMDENGDGGDWDIDWGCENIHNLHPRRPLDPSRHLAS